MEPIPQHWTTASEQAQGPDGRTYALRIWGWSSSSLAEARQLATRRLAEVVQRIRTGQRPDRHTYYPRMPLREELLSQVHGPDGAVIAQITRNRYGAEVLNTDQIVIADVDLPQQETGSAGRGFLSGLFGRRRRSEPPAPTGPDPELHRIEQFAAANPSWGVHAYRTAAGYRVLVTGTGAAPDSAQAQQIMADLASDPVYVTLCATHNTYRARLTPKPWRCGLRALTSRWPWADGPAADRAASWIEDYRRRSADYAVCEKVGTGSAAPSPAEGMVLDAHDRAVLGRPGQRLA